MSATIPPDGAASSELVSEPLPGMVRLKRRLPWSRDPGARTPSDVGRAAWFFLAPALVLIFVFFFLPVLASLVLSVTDFDIYAIANPSSTRFVGLANYVKLFHAPEFWQALKNTLYFAVVGGPLTIAVSLGAALLLNARLVRFKSFFRTVYFTPFVTTLVAVTLPLLGPTLLFVGVITMIGYFQLFSEPYVMTQGGPLRATTSVVLMMYEEGFRWWRMGYAAAIAFVLFLVILIATLIQFRLQKDHT